MVKWAYLIQLDYVGVSDLLEDVDLSCHTLDVGLVFDLVLFEDFDCNLLVSYCVSSDPHFSESTLSQ